ncbi:site-specific integrase [Pseudomonas syringae]|nr:site-specific integrase [Pseudomonas syringae]
MKLKRYQYNSIPFVTIVDEMDLPIDPYVSCYINKALSAKAINTKVRYVNELMFALRYFKRKKIDLTTKIATGELISVEEYIGFYDDACLDVASLGSISNFRFSNVGDKQVRNLLITNQRGLAKVSNETLQGRLRRLRHYIQWLFSQFYDPKSVDENIDKRLKKLAAQIKLDEDSLKNKSSSVENIDESAIPDDVFEKLMSIIEPSSPKNPFKRSKLRNYLIVSILAQSGIRRGALAKLKISDARMWGTFDQLYIYRSDNDPTDPRTDKPNQKTKNHFATISPLLMRDIKHYIEVTRASYEKSNSHDFIFISENDSKGTLGEPISLKSINSIFRKLSQATGFHIHPHMVRHKWNEIFDQEGIRQGVHPARMEDLRKYAMGWSQNSIQNQRYNDKQLARMTRELMIAHQNKTDK